MEGECKQFRTTEEDYSKILWKRRFEKFFKTYRKRIYIKISF